MESSCSTNESGSWPNFLKLILLARIGSPPPNVLLLFLDVATVGPQSLGSGSRTSSVIVPSCPTPNLNSEYRLHMSTTRVSAKKLLGFLGKPLPYVTQNRHRVFERSDCTSSLSHSQPRRSHFCASPSLDGRSRLLLDLVCWCLEKRAMGS
jgi:hypothetical protein